MSERPGDATSAAAQLDPLTAKSREHPEKLAVIVDDPSGRQVRWTYADLERRANRLAHALQRQGCSAGRTTLLWCGKNSPEVVVLGHASRKCGLTAVPLNYRLTDEEATYVIDNSDSTLAWIDFEFVPLFERIRGDLPKLDTILVFDHGDRPLPDGMTSAVEFVDGCADTPPEKEEIESRTMIYTSGTTGKPKGAVRTGQGNPDQLAGMVGHIGYGADEVYLTTGPLYHSGPGGFMGIAFLLGHTIVLQRNFEAEDWLRLVQEHRVSSTFAAPTPVRRICNLPAEVKGRYDTSSMRFMIANAAPWPFPLKQAYAEDLPPESLFEVYGSTELGVNMILRPEDQFRKPGSCGKPAPLVEARLYTDDGEIVTEPNQPGELFVRSLSVFDEYHKAHDRYDEDRRGEFHTVGDIAYFDDEGFYYICDRKKDMIISGGMNIYPAEIEAALEASNGIYEAAVFGIPDEEWGETVHAVVVPAPGTTIDERFVDAHAREHLAGYKVPRSVSFLDELPKTGSGKILKRELRKPFWEGTGRSV